MTSDAVEGDVYPVGFGIEVDTVEVWVSYFNITADPPSGSSVKWLELIKSNKLNF